MSEKDKIRISVRNLVEFILRSGDIDSRHGARMEKDAMQAGSRLHRKIQGRMRGNYQAEVSLSAEIPGEGYVLSVEGRADGIFHESAKKDGACGEGLKPGDGRDIVLLESEPDYGRDIAPQESETEYGRNIAPPESETEYGRGIAPPEPETEYGGDAAMPGLEPWDDGSTAMPGPESGDDGSTATPVPDGAVRLPADSRVVFRLGGQEKPAAAAAPDELYFIDEIKGVYRDISLMKTPAMLHLAQAKCYAYIFAGGRGLDRIGVQMTYCNLETEEIRQFRLIYDTADLERWFLGVVGLYQKWVLQQIKWLAVRNTSIGELKFPYPWREGQKEVASSVYRTILRKKKLFLQAPTGTGKTLSTVFPAVKAVGEGLAERIFYATAKTITRTVAEEAYKLLRAQGLHLRVVTLTAKEKICFLEETECSPEACPYAKGHFDRVNDAVFELITTHEVLDRPTIEAQALKWQVCPFEMGLDASLWADAVICDYNYIFDPRARLKRFFGEGVKGEYLFLIDEAHNLVERGREMFSASLYKEDFLSLKREIRPYSRKMAGALKRCSTWLLDRKRESTADNVTILQSPGTLPTLLMNLSGIMEDFLEDSKNAEINEQVLDLYFKVLHFLDACDRQNENYLTYTELCPDGRFLLRLFCVDISQNLQECLGKGRSTVFFSATLLPIQYYRKLLSAGKDDYAIYAHSSFDAKKRLVMVGADTSSRYRRRNAGEFRRMAEYILELIRAKRGNYMVFFSSYKMMEDVAEQFRLLCEEQGEMVELSCQEAGMREERREAFLAQFEQPHLEGFAGFCVMGGIFGEGIDLREDRLIGAVVVGTGLPQVCTERELLKYFYDRRGEDGFFYAYLCPGMNKVLQSAGRVIRTEEDRGVILLLDERFCEPRYRPMYPAEWEQMWQCTVQNVRRKAEEFWSGEGG